MAVDRILYRILTGSWGRFVFLPVNDWNHGFDSSHIPSNLDSIGIYVHIPFCRSICPFCPYNKILYDPCLAKAYSQCIKSETRQIFSRIGNTRISSIYFGGGTPLILADSIETLVRLMEPYLNSNTQVAVEVHPHDLAIPNDSPAFTIDRLVELGVNMVSLGAESLDDKTLQILGRDHDSAAALTALEKLMGSGKFAVNVDLITGIPHQTHESVMADITRLFQLGVDQISAYPLMDFPYTKLQNPTPLRKQGRLLKAITIAANRYGYRRSSVWTWTLPTSPIYSSITRANYVGIGASAATFLDREFKLNTFDVEAYIATINNNKPATALAISLGPKESALYRLFWQCYEGEFQLDSPEALAIPALPRLVNLAERMGLVRRLAANIQLTEKGFFAYHILERYYTRKYISKLWQICRSSAFPETVRL